MAASRQTDHRPFWKVKSEDNPQGRALLRSVRRFRRAHVKGKRPGRNGGLNAGKGIIGYPRTFKAAPLEDFRNAKRRRMLRGGNVYIADTKRPRTRTRGGRRLV
ncbi:MAG TPA: hypothetical protein VF170_01825 [Planctomycetaceae bacterium]